MKLRIHDRSLRFRLTGEDLDALRERGRVESALVPPAGERPGFAVSLRLLSTGAPSIEIDERGIHVALPEADAEALIRDAGTKLAREVLDRGGTFLLLNVEMDEPDFCPARTSGRPCPLKS